MAGLLEFFKTSLIDGTWECTSYECQSITLGALIKNMAAQGILEGGRGSFQGMSASKAAQTVEDIKPLDIEWHPKSGSWHKCHVLSKCVNAAAISGRSIVKPLELDNFRGTAG
jgi:hypothetical protein